MKVNRRLLYRAWRYFRDGYAIYVSRPLSIINFLTVTFYLLIERVPFLKFLLPHFYLYAVVGTVFLIPVSILFGWLHMRKTRIHGTEAILLAESNPLTAHTNRVNMENTLKILKALNISPNEEWWGMYRYWKQLDEKWRWKP